MRKIERSGTPAQKYFIGEEFETELLKHAHQYDVDLLMMDAYGHSRIYYLIIGGKTAAMLSMTTIPMPLLR